MFVDYSEWKLAETCNNPPLPQTLQPWSEYVTLLRTDSSKILQVSDYHILITIKFRLVRLLRTLKRIFTAPPPPQMLLLPPLLSCMAPRLPPLPLVSVPLKKKRNTHVNKYIYIFICIYHAGCLVRCPYHERGPITRFFVGIQHKHKCIYVYTYMHVRLHIYICHARRFTHFLPLPLAQAHVSTQDTSTHVYIHVYISIYISRTAPTCVALCCTVLQCSCSVLQGMYIYIYTHSYLNIHVMRGTTSTAALFRTYIHTKIYHSIPYLNKPSATGALIYTHR